MRPLIAGVRVLLICCSLALVGGCATSSQSGITYGFYLNIINLTVNTPTPLNTVYQVLCPKGQSVLAGGFNLNGPTALADWGEAHPPLSDAVDTNGLYRPIPELLRVDASLPLPGLNGWTIHVAGQAYPGASRSLDHRLCVLCGGSLDCSHLGLGSKHYFFRNGTHELPSLVSSGYRRDRRGILGRTLSIWRWT